MPVELLSRKRPRFPLQELRARAQTLCAEVGRPKDFLTVLLSDDAELRALNLEWRGQDAPTDVLSFELAHAHVLGTAVLGDLAISVETARRQAKEHGHDLLTEVTILCAHGILHLCGHDHERSYGDATRMLKEERRVLRAVGVSRGALTERGASSKATAVAPKATASARKVSPRKVPARAPAARKVPAKRVPAKRVPAKRVPAKRVGSPV